MNYSDFIVDKMIYKTFNVDEIGTPFNKSIFSEPKTIEKNLETVIGNFFLTISGKIQLSLSLKYGSSSATQKSSIVRIYENNVLIAEETHESYNIVIFANVSGMKKIKVTIETTHLAKVNSLAIKGYISDKTDEYIIINN